MNLDPPNPTSDDHEEQQVDDQALVDEPEFDEELIDGYTDEYLDEEIVTVEKSKLFCWFCNRPETHVFLPSLNPVQLVITQVLTIGLIRFVGPFQCVCCGHRRWFRHSRREPSPSSFSKRFAVQRERNIDLEWEREVRRENRVRIFRGWLRKIRRLFKRRDMHF
ncbi:MAG TPA: hypothetical protein PKD64_13735 [Pirellulaceae bacterium]|nr:hypothetical protein [Pirellulaceae bacterium]HMO93247.1 hypothetical protein [Pirellulaceae bacterium]HMP69112.1 hypothetical protein [Pirellulaceae bacterium]